MKQKKKIPKNFRLDPENFAIYNKLAAKGQAGAFLNRCIRKDAKAYLTKLAREKRNFKRGLRQ
jgi:hypothetical protein